MTCRGLRWRFVDAVTGFVSADGDDAHTVPAELRPRTILPYGPKRRRFMRRRTTLSSGGGDCG